ncbi:unnamed protein product [Spodoptera exigua]|nr:unnamed protein product [Spodoptera exigua]
MPLMGVEEFKDVTGEAFTSHGTEVRPAFIPTVANYSRVGAELYTNVNPKIHARDALGRIASYRGDEGSEEGAEAAGERRDRSNLVTRYSQCPRLPPVHVYSIIV